MTTEKMSHSEAGRLGALAKIKKYGPGVLSAMGRNGGLKTKRLYGHLEYFSRIGEAGGQAAMVSIRKKYGDEKLFYSRIGTKGGKVSPKKRWGSK